MKNDKLLKKSSSELKISVMFHYCTSHCGKEAVQTAKLFYSLTVYIITLKQTEMAEELSKQCCKTKFSLIAYHFDGYREDFDSNWMYMFYQAMGSKETDVFLMLASRHSILRLFEFVRN